MRGVSSQSSIRSYVSSLQVLHSHYLLSLRDARAKLKVSEEQLADIFMNIEIIFNLHTCASSCLAVRWLAKRTVQPSSQTWIRLDPTGT